MYTGELRRGNYVSVRTSNVFKVDVIGKNHIEGITIESEFVNQEKYHYRSSEHDYHTEPIPLTEEWLIKFGFHSDQGDELGVYRKQVGNNMDFMVNLITGEAGFSMGWRNDFCSVWKEVKYVHEVQNIIYFLSNEELEVK